MGSNKTLISNYLRTLSGQPKTPDMVRRYVDDVRLVEHIAAVEAAFPNYQIHVDDMLAERDMVVVRGRFEGLHRGPFAGIEATGRSVSAGLIIIYRVENNRIVDHWMQFDTSALLQQLQETAATVSL
jgi:predicted ester cyclase